MSQRRPAPLAQLATSRHNLPVQMSSFIGREQELRDTRRLLVATRLLTLIGAGGVGKTRLAIQLAATLLDTYPAGLWLVDMTPVTHPRRVIRAVAHVLNVHEVSGRPLLRLITDTLGSQRVLLVLDNCEHVLADAARLADFLLRNCPELRVLATSREPLGLDGEQVWRVPSLSVPQVPDTAERITRSEAARLFLERAQAAEPTFTLTDATAIAVADICRRLDGIPLALELAAARTRLLSAEQIADRLDDRFRLLIGGRTAPPRQQTLLATLDWSHGLLPETERRLLRRLAVFSGGWTLEAADAVCPDEGMRREDVLDLLGHLVDKSLILAESQPDGARRYRLLETVRTYAQARLAEAQQATEVQERHAAYFASLVRSAEPDLRLKRWGDWLDRLEREHDNVRAALDWLTVHGRIDQALDMSYTLSQFWEARGYASEGRERLGRLLEVPDVDARVRAGGLYGTLTLEWSQGDNLAFQRHCEELLALNEDLGDGAGVASALHDLAVVAIQQRRYADARRLLNEHLALSLRHGVPPSPRARQNLGNLARDSGDFIRAHAMYADALVRDGQSESMRGSILSNLGWLALYEGDLPRARAWQAESLAIRRQLGERREVPISLTALAHVAIEASEPVTASALLMEALPPSSASR